MNQPSIITTKLNIVTVGSNVTVAQEEKTTKGRVGRPFVVYMYL